MLTKEQVDKLTVVGNPFPNGAKLMVSGETEDHVDRDKATGRELSRTALPVAYLVHPGEVEEVVPRNPGVDERPQRTGKMIPHVEKLSPARINELLLAGVLKPVEPAKAA